MRIEFLLHVLLELPVAFSHVPMPAVFAFCAFVLLFAMFLRLFLLPQV